MPERIETLHPSGKAGVNIEKEKYDAVREAILASIPAGGSITFAELGAAVRVKLAGTFQGSVSWYVTTVKLDLEARGEIARAPQSSPQRLVLGPGPAATDSERRRGCRARAKSGQSPRRGG